MADEPQVIRGIDWKSTFPFTLIFRSFRIAVHPSKLVLALSALVLICIGGWVLDGIWPNASQAVPGELDELFVQSRDAVDPSEAFVRARDQRRKEIVNRFETRLKSTPHSDGGLADIRANIIAMRDNRVEEIRKEYDAAVTARAKEIETDPSLQTTLANQRDALIRETFLAASEEYDTYTPYEGVGLFNTFFDHELGQAHAVVRRARDGVWIAKGGVIDQTFSLFTVAPSWAMRYHPAFFTIFGIYFLIIWAIFGGAIARIAAVQVARDEKISFRQALSFSTAKFLSFVSAPIIPLAIIAGIGLIVFLVSLILFNIPFLGPIAGGLLFVLALIAGFTMTLVLIGLFGGFNLMYPTIAVEGSDSFDAISRSFSYLYARPWRLAFHTIVAAIYGTLCYVFVRFFIKVMLSLTHAFVGFGVFRRADNAAPLWPTLFPDPLIATRLSYSVDWLTLGAGEKAGAFFIMCWVYLVIAALGAFAISFYFSANTIIYVLMRYEVDATELDDVYLEQTEEEFSDAPPPVDAPVEPPPSAPSSDAPPATT